MRTAIAGDGPVSAASMVESIIGCKWSVRVLEVLASGRTRPSAILRACPGLSAKVLNERLRKLVRFGIVVRTVTGERPPVQVEYPLTPLGRRFLRVLAQVHALQAAIDADATSEPAKLSRAPARRAPAGRAATPARPRPPRARS